MQERHDVTVELCHLFSTLVTLNSLPTQAGDTELLLQNSRVKFLEQKSIQTVSTDAENWGQWWVVKGTRIAHSFLRKFSFFASIVIQFHWIRFLSFVPWVLNDYKLLLFSLLHSHMWWEKDWPFHGDCCPSNGLFLYPQTELNLGPVFINELTIRHISVIRRLQKSPGNTAEITCCRLSPASSPGQATEQEEKM